MIIFISTIVFTYLLDSFLVGVSFFALKERFQWSISRRLCLLILFILFAFLEYYMLPMVLVLDVTFTVGNSDIAAFFGLRPDEPFAGLFGFGAFEIIIILLQALLAALVGEKMFVRKSVQNV